MIAPLVPALNDAAIEANLDAVATTGARHAGYVMLREVAPLFLEWLQNHYPLKARCSAHTHGHHRQIVALDALAAKARNRPQHETGEFGRGNFVVFAQQFAQSRLAVAFAVGCLRLPQAVGHEHHDVARGERCTARGVELP